MHTEDAGKSGQAEEEEEGFFPHHISAQAAFCLFYYSTFFIGILPAMFVSRGFAIFKWGFACFVSFLLWYSRPLRYLV